MSTVPITDIEHREQGALPSAADYTHITSRPLSRGEGQPSPRDAEDVDGAQCPLLGSTTRYFMYEASA